MNSILGYLELEDKRTANVQTMQTSALYVLSLLENLIGYSAIESDSTHISNSIFSLNNICTEAGQMFKPLAGAKDLAFEFSAERVTVDSDLLKIKQIVFNLVSNAVKYTRKGSILLRMEYAEGKIRESELRKTKYWICTVLLCG